MGVDPLPTPTGSWLFVERRGEEFFPVVPLTSAKQGELQAAGPAAVGFANGPYLFRKLRTTRLCKRQQLEGQPGGVHATASDTASPDSQPGDPTLQQQQQQTPLTGKPRMKRPRAWRVLSRPGRAARASGAL
jgi:hypothetical protein